MTPLTDGSHNDDVIQLVPLRSQSLFQFVQISDAYFTSSPAIFPTLCNQLDSNLANFEGHSCGGLNSGVLSVSTQW